jgi:putative tryptophan/tyrosine transport system substrate-binding protein
MMRRRDLIAVIAGTAAAWPLAARAQQPKRVAALINSTRDNGIYLSRVAEFQRSLRSLGWIEGKNLQLDIRWGELDPETMHREAAELAALAPDAILATGTSALTAIQRATRTIPIVFVQVSDPVEQGFVTNIAHPGGNATGFAAYESSFGGKWLDLLKQMVPNLRRAAVMFNPETAPQATQFFGAVLAAGQSMGVEVAEAPLHADGDIEPAIARVSQQSNAGLVFIPDNFTIEHAATIARLAARYRVPAIYTERPYLDAGGLMRYGINFDEQFRQAGIYVDRILRGTPVGDLAIQYPTKFTLGINLTTARARAIDVPVGLLLIADEQIE